MAKAVTFRDKEKERYQVLKTQLFSPEACCDGNYKGKQYCFCLDDNCSQENIYEGFRKEAIQYFSSRNIQWHDGLCGRRFPSNHLCCSQSCCINFLYAMTEKPDLIARVFGQFYPELKEPLPIYADELLPDGSFPYMAFEWIGSKDTTGHYKDYLGEQKNKKGSPTRGANYTSADFAFRFRRKDGNIQLVLGEWKYTEYYGRTDRSKPRNEYDKKPEVRKRTYRKPFSSENGVFKERTENIYTALFFEPFYQLMRLQLLAQEMEFDKLLGSGGEMDGDLVTVLHVSPEANKEFRDSVHSPELLKLFPNSGVLDIWKELVSKDKFISVSVESLLDKIEKHVTERDRDWVNYLTLRYAWKK